jgi:putative acetyltransferase
MKIRHETSGDETAIHHLTAKAFEPMEYSDGSEPAIIDRLRADGDLELSLVAIVENEIVGHIAFSKVTIGGSDNNWFGLGPVSVAIDRQKSGIGSKLINEGLAQIKANGAQGCVLIGDPAYYSRFGFKSDKRVTYNGFPNEFVQWLSLDGSVPIGEIKYRRAFDGG